MGKNELFSLLAECHLGIETLATRNSDGAGFPRRTRLGVLRLRWRLHTRQAARLRQNNGKNRERGLRDAYAGMYGMWLDEAGRNGEPSPTRAGAAAATN